MRAVGAELARPFAWTAVRVSAAWTAIGLAVAFSALYLVLGPDGTTGVYGPLADALLNGRLAIVDRPWLELVPASPGSIEQYVPLPPGPALTLMPAVALLGPEISVSAPAAIVGGANVSLAYLLARRLGAERAALPIAIAFATATHLWVAGNGGPHHYAQLVGVAGTLIALLAAAYRRVPVLAGLALGLAAASRLPMGLTLPLILWLYGSRPSRDHLLVLVGILGPALAVAGYNVARFGSPTDFGYARIPSGESGLVTDEWWYSEGILSLSYIPRSLGWALFGGLSLEPPFLSPSWMGMTLILTAPVIFLAVRARGALAAVAGVAIVAVLLPDLAHGAWGFSQWGYRFVLDAMPAIVVLLAIAYRRGPDVALYGAIAVGLVANLAGFAFGAA